MNLAIASLIYLTAHFLRGVRFWLLIKKADLPLRSTFAVYQITNTLGGLFLAPVAELARIFALIRLAGPGTWIAVISVSVFCRLLDFIVASAPLLRRDIDSSALLTFLMVGLVLGFATCSRDALSFTKKVLVARGHSRWHLHLIRFLGEIESGFYTFLEQPLSNLIFNVLMTLTIWALDVFALTLIGEHLQISDPHFFQLVNVWSEFAYGRFFGISTPESTTLAIQTYLLKPQLIYSLILSAALGLTYWPARKGVLWKSH